MTALAGTISYTTTVVLTAASSGDGATIAAAFNGQIIAPVSVSTTATAVNNSGTVTITWPSLNVRAGDSSVLTAVLNIIAGMTSLTSPVSAVTVSTVGKVV